MKFFNPIRDLNKFELSLWLLSVTVIIVSFLLSGGKDIMTIIASLIGVTALIFVAKGYVVGQILTVVFAIFYGIVSFCFRYYGEMITYLGMTAPSAIATIISWVRHPYKDTKEVKVNHLSKRLWFIMMISGLIVTTVFYYILSALGTANIVFSTISVTTSFVASYLTFFRSQYYAIGYAANDVVLIILWVLATISNRRHACLYLSNQLVLHIFLLPFGYYVCGQEE